MKLKFCEDKTLIIVNKFVYPIIDSLQKYHQLKARDFAFVHKASKRNTRYSRTNKRYDMLQINNNNKN